MKLGQVIKELREKRGMSVEEFAEKTGIGAKSIHGIENGEISAKALEGWPLDNIAKALEVPKEVILFKALEPSDIPEAKQEAFKGLSPAINDLLNQVF